MNHKEFGHLIAALRKEHFDEEGNRLTQAKLAEKVQQHDPHSPLNEIIIGKIERRLRRELKRIPPGFLPGREMGQELLQCPLVADEIVVDEVDMATIAEIVQRLKLGQHLGCGLGPRHPSEQLDDVAKLAIKRATA